MSGTAAVAIVVVVWLFVLAPLVLRGQKPIRRTSKAFAETRVVYEGDSELPQPRRPFFSKKDVTYTEASAPVETSEVVSSEDVLIEDEPRSSRSSSTLPAPEIEGTVIDDGASDSSPAAPASDTSNAVDAEGVDADRTPFDADAADAHTDRSDEPVVPVAEQPAADVAFTVVDGHRSDDDVEYSSPDQDYYEIESYYSMAADSLHPRAAADDWRAYESDQAQYDEYVAEAEEVRGTGAADSGVTGSSAPRDAAQDAEAQVEEPLPEDQQFVAQHPGRGWYNPAADAHRASTRYQRRQRTLIVLLALVAVGAVLGFGLGGSWWYMPIVATAVTSLYLFELRRQVCAERELRRRRIHNLRRARMGVQLADADTMAVPPRLRHPGAVVLEMDDESPDFEYLETRVVDEEYDDYIDDEPVRGTYARAEYAGAYQDHYYAVRRAS